MTEILTRLYQSLDPDLHPIQRAAITDQLMHDAQTLPKEQLVQLCALILDLQSHLHKIKPHGLIGTKQTAEHRQAIKDGMFYTRKSRHVKQKISSGMISPSDRAYMKERGL